MKTSDILKLIEYKITGGSVFNTNVDNALLQKYKLTNELRLIEYHDESKSFNNRDYDGNILINGDKVLRITLSLPSPKSGYFRWTEPKCRSFFKEMAKKNHDDDTIAFDNVKYNEVFLLEEILIKIQDMMKTGTCSLEVSYPLEIDDEFIQLANLSAKKEGVSVETWISHTIETNQEHFKRKQI